MINQSRSNDQHGSRVGKKSTSLIRLAPKSRSRFGKQPSRYEVLKAEIGRWWNDRFVIAVKLREIKDEKLYKDEYETFDEFCLTEYGIGRTYSGRLLNALETKESLPVPIGTAITNESQARSLSEVKEDQRVNVLERVVESGKPVTAKAITEAIKPGERKKKPKPVAIDVTPEPKPQPRVHDCPMCRCDG